MPTSASRSEYDAVVVGSGPNGLVGAIRLAQAGLSVLVVEQGAQWGGGLRTEELTLPGFRHDTCATVHALAGASPAMRSLGLEAEGLEWAHPEIPVAHPIDGQPAALLKRSPLETSTGLGSDAKRWQRLVGGLAPNVESLADSLLDPLSIPSARSFPVLARFGATGALPADVAARGLLRTEGGRALFGGLAAHSMLGFGQPGTTGFATFLGALAHGVGWPVAVGGSQSFANALVARLRSLGGDVVTDTMVRSRADIPSSRLLLLDLDPRQVARLLRDDLPSGYARRLGSFRHGPGVFKIDWALDGPVPWTDPAVARAGTVHLGGTYGEVAAAEKAVASGRIPQRPFVLFVQASVADATRAPGEAQTAWAYCHVPNGSTVDMTAAIEAQVERFAPGFLDRVLARHVMSPAAMQQHNPNYVGGDIGGGAADLRQFITRPVTSRSPWRTPVSGAYLASASTPPGAGVHGMGGWIAARTALADLGITELEP